MEIVIKIPKEIYTGEQKAAILPILVDAIGKGIPLPAHHGRLIDADALEYSCNADECGILTGCNYCQYNIVTKDEIDNAPTILEGE